MHRRLLLQPGRWVKRRPHLRTLSSSALAEDHFEEEARTTRNIGISAHIDSGKTTLTERILYFTGRIKSIHDVRGRDGVGAKMDSMDLEREKGITIQSAATHCKWGDHHVNIIDTPGHVDFTIEVERALRVLDGGVLVLCGVAGVQSHCRSQSLTVDRQMKRYDIPRVAFVNKLDRMGADPWKVIGMVRKQMHLNASAVQVPIGLEEAHHGVVDIIRRVAITFDGEKGEDVRETTEVPAGLQEKVEAARLELIERVSDVDDELADLYLTSDDPKAIAADEVTAAIRRATRARTFVPVFMGSAYKNKGVQPLLDGVVKYLPSPIERETVVALAVDEKEKEVPIACNASEPFLALAFKLEESRFGQLTYVRIYRGTLKKGAYITNVRTRKQVKVPRVVRMHSDEMEDIATASAGDVVAMFGVDCASMDTFEETSKGNHVRLALASMFVPRPVISLAVAPKKGSPPAVLDNFSGALQRFTKEDPTLRVHTDPESKETILSGMGELHLEVYVERLKREYNVDTTVGNPKVNYREAITTKVNFDYLHKKQTGGSGQYARVIGYIEPLGGEDDDEEDDDDSEDDDSEEEEPDPANKTFDFSNELIGQNIPPEFIPSCEKGAVEAVTKGGLVGAAVEGIRVGLVDGVAHAIDSSDLAFRTAMIYGVRAAIAKASPHVLEPIMTLEVHIPAEFQGDVLGGINQRRGLITNTDISDDGAYATLLAEVPLANMFGYSTILRSQTQGKGEFSMEYKAHEKVAPDAEVLLVKKYQDYLQEQRDLKK